MIPLHQLALVGECLHKRLFDAGLLLLACWCKDFGIIVSMKSAMQALYEMHAPRDLSAEETCVLCGGDWYPTVATKMATTFTDYDRLNTDNRLVACEACRFMLDEQNKTVQAWTGKEKPQRPRNYSHILKSGTWHVLSKGQKADMHALLLGSVPEVAIIATSGQKHLFFKARLNPPDAQAGWVNLEEVCFWMTAEAYADTYAHVSALYDAGYNKASIESGQYVFYPDSDVDVWRAHERAIKPLRGAPLLALAVYLVTKTEDES